MGCLHVCAYVHIILVVVVVVVAVPQKAKAQLTSIQSNRKSE